ncbi:MAG: sodium:solute symporter [Acidobacteriota bacterium]|nr:sodium:solute symporter [Blastocatellia bacterium]MDW8239735.1 sodium:solute symporter [Acidobacteriota bacterium]
MTVRSLDLVIIVGYLVAIVLFGASFKRHQKNLKDYFLGGQQVPWWAISLSIVATETSTLTFIGVPGLSYAANGNMTFLQLVMGYLVGRIIISVLFIPSYFRGQLLTVYQLLEHRFGDRVKMLAASIFLVMRNLADGVRLLATAVVLMALTGIDDITSIVVMGVVMIIFTYLGGMAAVIWTEVVQLFVYIGGAALAAYILLSEIPGGWQEVQAVGTIFNKFQVFDFTWDVSQTYTFWAGVIGGAFFTTSTHGTDQFLVQRYLCTASSRQATAALLSSWVIIFAQFVGFLLIGIMLFTFYQRFPPMTTFARQDDAFPYFIIHHMPAGLSGLVVAAIFAAALSSSLNSSAATTLSDLIHPLRKRSNPAPDDEARDLRLSHTLTIFWGLVQIGVAIMARESKSLLEAGLSIAALTNGSLLGVFLLGTLTTRVTETGALIGMITGLGVMLWVKLGTSIAWPWHVLLGSLVTFSSGWFATKLISKKSS